MNLKPREKQVVIIAFACIAMLIAFQVFIRPALNRKKDLQRVVPEKKAILSELQAKSSDYNSLKQKLEQIRSKIESQQKDRKILSSIERIQKDCGLTTNVANITPSTMKINDEYEKTSVEIKYDKVTLAQIIQFLQKVESSDLLIGIKSMEIKRGLQNPALLDIVIQLVTVSYIDKG
jgi:type II secretory pathway component PulM